MRAIPLSLLVVVGTGVLGATSVLGAVGCKRSKAGTPPDEPPPPLTVTSVTSPVPPVAPFNATPAAQLLDAAVGEGATPLEQARALRAEGQLWKARLLLEPRALSSTSKTAEAELLATICVEQADAECVAACSTRLGRKIPFDAGVRTASSGEGAKGVAVPVLHQEPEGDLAAARDHLLHGRPGAARKLLEPRVLDGRASREEIRMLRAACNAEADRMCVALCDAKLK